MQLSASDPQLRAADTFLWQAQPNSKNGGLGSLLVWSLTNGNARSIVQFDFSSLPNVGVKSAILTLHVELFFPPFGSRVYNAHRVTSFFHEPDASWNTRVANLSWGTPGGDFSGVATSSATVGPSSASVSWDITPDVQSWYNGTPNYGTLIRDSQENAGGFGFLTEFGSKEDSNPANRPLMTVTFVQNVANLTATPGNGVVTLGWAYPAPLGTVLEPNAGVLILRRANLPVDGASVPVDGADPGLCATVGTGVVVFDNFANATSFVDNASDPCGAPVNDTTWYYKVFLRDVANNYTSNGGATIGGSASTAEISATPSAANLQNSVWITATGSTFLAAPALDPGSVVMGGSQSNLLVAMDATTGLRKYPPVSVGGPVTDRAPIINAADSSLGQSVIYVADQDGLIYAIATDTGRILWVVNPTGLTTNAFQGAASVFLKSVSGPGYARSTDLVVAGTRDSATTTSNRVVAVDGNTGATVWQVVGNSGGNPPMDIISSIPEPDYARNAVWVTSRSNGGAGQPSLWKIDINSGAVLATAALGDIDSSPSLSPVGDFLFVGSDVGILYAINPATAAVLASFNLGDGAVVGYPAILNFFPPFTIVFSSATLVNAVRYDAVSNTFTSLWSTPINTPSAPISFPGFSKVYVGANDGMIHELDLATGVDGRRRTVNTGLPGFVGDPSLDLVLDRIYVSTTDQRMYAFTFPF